MPDESENPIGSPRQRNILPPLVPWAAFAVTVAVAAYLAVENHRLHQTVSEDQRQIVQLSVADARAQELVSVLTDRDAQRVILTEGKLATAPTAHISYLPARGALIFIADSLRPVPVSKTYELWVIPTNHGAPIAAGTFRPASNGTASVILPPLPSGVAARTFGVTVENAGGSTTPSLPIILSGAPGT